MKAAQQLESDKVLRASNGGLGHGTAVVMRFLDSRRGKIEMRIESRREAIDIKSRSAKFATPKRRENA